MNTLDIILGILLLVGLVRGVFRGFLAELAGLIALILAIYGAIYFSDSTLNILRKFIDWEIEYLEILSFALTFILIVVAISLLGTFLTKMVNLLALGIVNKLLGGVFGILKTAFILSVFFMFLNQSVSLAIGRETKETSILYRPVERIAPMLLPTVLQKLKEEGIFDSYESEQE